MFQRRKRCFCTVAEEEDKQIKAHRSKGKMTNAMFYSEIIVPFKNMFKKSMFEVPSVTNRSNDEPNNIV